MRLVGADEPSYILIVRHDRPAKGVQRDVGATRWRLASAMKYIFCGEPGETMFRLRHRLGGGHSKHHMRRSSLHDDDHVRGVPIRPMPRMVEIVQDYGG